MVVLKDFFLNPDYYNSYNLAKTVKLEHNTNKLLDPIIQFQSNEKLKLSFDILSEECSSYAYTFIHCNANWEYSNITQSDYLVGFYDNYIDDYNHSFNTLTKYCHYYFSFPNESINFSKSGNYIVLIYDAEKNTPVATKRFIIKSFVGLKSL